MTSGDPRAQQANKILNDEIKALKEQVRLARRRQANDLPSGIKTKPQEAVVTENERASTIPPSTSADVFTSETPEQQQAIDILDARTNQLQQIGNWISQDADLLPLLGKLFQDDVRKRARQNLVLNIILSTIFLIAGWILSIVATPTNIGNYFK